MNKPTMWCLLIGLLPVAAVSGQNAVVNPEQPLIDYSLSGDVFSETKLGGNQPANTLLRNFDTETNRFQLNAATLSVQITKGQFGLHLDSGYGGMYSTMNASDPLGGANRYFGQAFVSVRPLPSSDLAVDFGKFYTSVGAEVPDSAANANYSRSLLFALGSPYYHFGLRASKSLSKSLSVGAQVTNGWNDVVNNTHGHTLGLNATYTRKYVSWTTAYLGGPTIVPSATDPAGRAIATPRQTHLADSILKFAPNRRITGYLEGLFGEADRAGGRRSQWYGAAAAVTLPVGARWSVTPRWEYYNDTTGATSGVAQQLHEFTATAQYLVRRYPVTARVEYRGDASNRSFFVNGKTLSHRQDTVLLALLYTWHGSR